MASGMSEKLVQIPAEVQVQVTARKVTVTGPKGTLSKDLAYMPVQFEQKEGKIAVWTEGSKRRDKAMIGTAASHISNMIKGVTEGFAYKLKIVYAHFPVTVKVLDKQKKISIENFSGEKVPRLASMVGDVSVKISGDEVTVEGTRLEDVSQTASNIQQATLIKEKDQRVFLDGIYVFEKGPAIKK